MLKVWFDKNMSNSVHVFLNSGTLYFPISSANLVCEIFPVRKTTPKCGRKLYQEDKYFATSVRLSHQLYQGTVPCSGVKKSISNIIRHFSVRYRHCILFTNLRVTIQMTSKNVQQYFTQKCLIRDQEEQERYTGRGVRYLFSFRPFVLHEPMLDSK